MDFRDADMNFSDADMGGQGCEGVPARSDEDFPVSDEKFQGCPFQPQDIFMEAASYSEKVFLECILPLVIVHEAELAQGSLKEATGESLFKPTMIPRQQRQKLDRQTLGKTDACAKGLSPNAKASTGYAMDSIVRKEIEAHIARQWIHHPDISELDDMETALDTFIGGNEDLEEAWAAHRLKDRIFPRSLDAQGPSFRQLRCTDEEDRDHLNGVLEWYRHNTDDKERAGRIAKIQEKLALV